MSNKIEPMTSPAPGEVIEIAPGILWARFALPFVLNHVNLYLIEDGDGWAVLDTGLGDEATKAAWQTLLDGPLKGQRLTRVICTHFHPDHVGLVAWMCEKYDLPLYMTITEYLQSLYFYHVRDAVDGDIHRGFYTNHGMSARAAEVVIERGHQYRQMITGVPDQYHRIIDGDDLVIGKRSFRILTGGGHSDEQAMLYCAEDGIFFGADQVLARITPNVGVSSMEPFGNPLGQYVHSLARIKRDIPDGTLVLPGHETPFTQLHQRIDEMLEHHDARCDDIARACADGPMSTIKIVPKIFTRELDEHQMTFAFSETLAHINMMVVEGRLVWHHKGNAWQVGLPE